MPKILPISDLRNYTAVLNQVDVDKPVYLTRNGRGTYVISKIDDYSREVTVEDLIKEIKKGEQSLVRGKASPIKRVAQNFDISL
jgi:PHD/YefM family antitoxin component YafN of YafNO toxin-antitoxin module